MFLNTIAAEWTKLRTTASVWWTSGLFILFSLGWAVITGLTTPDAEGLFPTLWAHSIALVTFVMGFCVLMIQATMLVTSEYRYAMASATYLATPRRWTVALAKFLLYSTIAAALTFACVFIGFYLARALSPESAAALFNPLEDQDAREIMWTYPAAAAAVVLFTQGIGLLLRQTAGSIALVLIWFLGLENIFRLIPTVGNDIVAYLPFVNLNAFVTQMGIDEVAWAGHEWSVNASGAYFLLWALVLWLLGVFALSRRDA